MCARHDGRGRRNINTISKEPALQRDNVGVGKLAIVHKHGLNRKVGRVIIHLAGVDRESVVRSAVGVLRPDHTVGPVRVASICTHHPTTAMQVVHKLGLLTVRSTNSGQPIPKP